MDTNNKQNNNSFDSSLFIGFVQQVNPGFVMIHIPASNLLKLHHINGEKHHPGLVGSYVTIEGEEFGFIGKILELDLPEKERMELTEQRFESEDLHPRARVEILISFDYYKIRKINKGLDTFPHVGARVFSCSSQFLQKYLFEFGVNNTSDDTLIDLAVLSSNQSSEVKVSSQSLFGRHCAVVGTTGGGKSWSVQKLIEEIVNNNGKAILIDATGEYQPYCVDKRIDSVAMGIDTYFDFSRLTVSDIFYLLKPSDKVQRPKLLDAIRSLKMVRINGKGKTELQEKKDDSVFTIAIEDGILKKSGCDKKAYDISYYRHIAQIENNRLDFDITKLSRQLVQECVWDPDIKDKTKYGSINQSDVSFCVSLVSRVNNLTVTKEFGNLFGFRDENKKGKTDLATKIESFLADSTKNLLRISLRDVEFEFQVREILVNSIGRFLLEKARASEFKKKGSLIVFIDEARQFLNKSVQDEYYSEQKLDSFDLIAKECRKHGLFICLATQNPRDIPLGTLSQMGTFIVHRLINRLDKEAIENACSSANRSILSFLPILGSGEALLIGVDFPMPLSVKIKPPRFKPDSKTPSVISKVGSQ